MMTRRTAPAFLAVFAMLACLVPCSVHGAAASPKWLAGFPLRAGGAIILMWTPIPGATGYRLVRKVGNEPAREIYNGPANSFNDPAVPATETVTYTVSGLLKGGESEISPPGTVKGIEQIQPPSFTGAIGSSNTITLRWSSPPGTMFSNIYRAESENGEYALQESVQYETFTDRNVEKGKIYHYRISSVGRDGKESPRSAPIQANLRAATARDAAPPETGVLRKLAARGSFRGEELYELNQPSYTGFTGEGELFVTERRGVQFFDLEGRYLRRIAFDKSWSLPGGPVEDRDGSFLVPFYSEQLVRRIDRTGKPAGELRYPPYADRKNAGPGKKSLPAARVEADPGSGAPPPDPARKFRNNPNQVAIDGSGNYWILDGVRAQAIQINGKGEELAVIGRPPGTFDEQDMKESDLPAARGIQYNPVDGKLYVALGVTAQIKVIDPKKAAVVATFGGLGAGNSRFQGIGGLAFRSNGNILVLDHLMQVVKEFNPKYEYVATYADVIERDTVKLSSNFLSSFAFAEKGDRFYVTSALGNRVYKFDILPPAPAVPPPPPPKPQPKVIWQ